MKESAKIRGVSLLAILPALIFLIGIVSAYPLQLDVCRASNLSIGYNYSANDTSFLMNVNGNLTCNNSQILKDQPSLNLSNQAVVPLNIYLWNGTLYFDNSTNVYTNESWIQNKFNEWYGNTNNSLAYTKSDINNLFPTKTDLESFKGIVSGTYALKTDLLVLTDKVNSINITQVNDKIANPDFGTGWKTVSVINLILGVGIAIFLIRSIMGSGE